LRFFRITYIAVFLLTICTFAYGQKEFKRSSVIRELKYNIKDQDYKKALENVQKAFREYPDQTLNDAEFYYYNTVANNNLALAEAKKMYLQEKPDTVKYFDFVYATMQSELKCDSLANIPNEKGKINNKFLKEMKNIYNLNMPKLSAASRYFFQKKNYQKAYDMSDLYVSNSESVNSEVSTVATISVLSAYTMSKYSQAMKHVEYSLADSSLHEQILEVACNCYMILEDTMNYEKYLEEGFVKYPESKFFYASLVSLYNAQHKYRKALAIVKDAIKSDCCNRDLWFIKGTEEMHLSERDSALISYTRATELMPNDAESYSYIGSIYLHYAHILYEEQQASKGREERIIKVKLHNTYKHARTAFEYSRQYAPKRTDLWLNGLKEGYYKLNLGKELQQLELKYP